MTALATTQPRAVLAVSEQTEERPIILCGIPIRSFEELWKAAQVMIASKMLPAHVRDPEQVIVTIQYGKEIGLPPMVSLRLIQVIQGTPTVAPQAMMALVEKSGQLADRVIEITPDFVSVTLQRVGRSPHTEVFGHENAVAMGLASKDNYKKQAQTMYKWRAISACCRVVFPDIINGLYTTEEIAPDTLISDEGEVIGPVAIEPPPSNNSGFGRTGNYAPDEVVKVYDAWIRRQIGNLNAKWLDDCTGPNGEIDLRGLPEQLTNAFEVSNHLIKHYALPNPTDGKGLKPIKAAAVAWQRDMAGCKAEVATYLRGKLDDATADWVERGQGGNDDIGDADRDD